jgi:hypothetical protein
MRSRSASANAATMVRNSFDRPLPAMSPPRSSRFGAVDHATEWSGGSDRERIGQVKADQNNAAVTCWGN